MSAPTYNKALSPIKNLQALIRFMGVAPIATTVEAAGAQVLAQFATLHGIADQAVTTVATAGAGTYTAAGFATGLIKRDCAGADRTDTTPTAAQIIAGLNLTANYQVRHVTIHNNSGGAYTITLAAGTGVTINGTITVAQGAVARISITRTSSTTVAIR